VITEQTDLEKKAARGGAVENDIGHRELAGKRLALGFVIDAGGEAGQLAVRNVLVGFLRSDGGGKRRVIGVLFDLILGKGLNDLACVLLGSRCRLGRGNILAGRDVDLLSRRILRGGQRIHVERGGIRKCASAKSHSREGRGAWQELH